jgi:hypothetical protein
VASRLRTRILSRTVTAVAVLLAAGLAIPSPAAASTKVSGTATGSEAISTGTWKATASVTSMTFTTNTDQLSTITNTGTVALSAVSYKVTVSNPTSGTPTFTIFTCAVAWVSGKCSGGAGTQVGGTFSKNSSTTVTSTQVPPLSGSVYLQVEPATVTSSVIVTLGTSISSPTQLRPSVKTDQ